jgi:hypothetical protein
MTTTIRHIGSNFRCAEPKNTMLKMEPVALPGAINGSGGADGHFGLGLSSARKQSVDPKRVAHTHNVAGRIVV